MDCTIAAIGAGECERECDRQEPGPEPGAGGHARYHSPRGILCDFLRLSAMLMTLYGLLVLRI
jgi:hypothetical protein